MTMDLRVLAILTVAILAALFLGGCGSGGGGGGDKSKAPTFPAAWKAHTHGNLTQPGLFMGSVDVQFAVDCTEGPAKQKMITVYPDHYTVITRCDLGYQYIIDPVSRGLSCNTWKVPPATCSQCGCPFCIQNTGKEWQKEVEWASKVGEESTRHIGGKVFKVRKWLGTQWMDDKAQSLPIEFAVSTDGKPVYMSVTSQAWITAKTWFENFTEGVGAHEFDPPASVTCPPIPSKQSPSLPVTDLTKDSSYKAVGIYPTYLTTVEAESSAAPAKPPTFPAQFKASVLVNISQPGYFGGNLFLNFTQDCSKGPSKQISKTIFGNFRAVQLDCSTGIVHAWNQPAGPDKAFACGIQGHVGVDFSSDVCNVCGLPFSVSSTKRVFTTSNNSDLIKFSWKGSEKHFEGVETSPGNYTLTMDTYPVKGDIPKGNGHETPQELLGHLDTAYRQTVNQVGWQNVMVSLSALSEKVNPAVDFALPPITAACKFEGEKPPPNDISSVVV